MKIDSLYRLGVSDLIDKRPKDYIRLHYGEMGAFQGVSWNYSTEDSGLHRLVKNHGGVWSGSNWAFDNDEKLYAFLSLLKKRQPKWPVLDDSPVGRIKSVHYELLISPTDEDAGLVVKLPLPFNFEALVQIPDGVQSYKLASGRSSIALFVGTKVSIVSFADSLLAQGAMATNKLVEIWGISAGFDPVQVTCHGWSVQVDCDLGNLHHIRLAPHQAWEWDAPYPMGTKRLPIPWTGCIKGTRKSWPKLLTSIDALRLTWSGDDPSGAIALPSAIRTEAVPGWNQPAPNGFLLHDYQKDGVRFCALKGMHALIGDEMGIGKTAQAICAAQAVEAPQIFVICPKSARYVWDREIKGWCGVDATIQHIKDQADTVDSTCRWHILTYDQIVSRRTPWSIRDPAEERAILKAFPELKSRIVKDPKKKTLKIVIDEFSLTEPALDQDRLVVWRKMMLRLQGVLLSQILSAGPITLIIDEAHRAKNMNSKRSQAIAKIAAKHRKTNVLLLTGTPLRNNEHEAAVLLGYLDPEARNVLSKTNGYSIQDVKDYLGFFMIRRTKKEVLPELPEKTRQRVDLEELASQDMADYQDALDSAVMEYNIAISAGRSEADARNRMRGGIARARQALGMAKVNGGQVADLVADVLEDKKCCVVFCAHTDVSDTLKAQLQAKEIKAAVFDGRTKTALARSNIENAFQAGGLDVFIGGINAAGEAITLTRADTVIFVELDWVPTALLQAEDRIHRGGQIASCLVLHLTAKFDASLVHLQNLDEYLIDVIGSKMDRIGSVLDEDQSNLVASEAKSAFAGQLLHQVGAKAAARPPTEELVRTQAVLIESTQEPIPLVDAVPVPQAEKRKRGRPKVYVDRDPLSASARSKLSVEALKQRGGKRLMLRLSPEGLSALKKIMEIAQLDQETETINRALVAYMKELSSMPATK